MPRIPFPEAVKIVAEYIGISEQEAVNLLRKMAKDQRPRWYRGPYGTFKAKPADLLEALVRGTFHKTN